MQRKDELTILNFLQDYKKWTCSGAPEGDKFNRGYGLCVNHILWWNFHHPHNKYRYCNFPSLKALGMFDKFKDREFPFNSGNGHLLASNARTHWLNKKRNKWVSDKIIALEKRCEK